MPRGLNGAERHRTWRSATRPDQPTSRNALLALIRAAISQAAES